MRRACLLHRRTENQLCSDFLLISEANDAESIIAALMAAAAAGTISDVTTARAWTGAEFKAIADKASKAQKAYRLPGKK
jgi:hypothetical protein